MPASIRSPRFTPASGAMAAVLLLGACGPVDASESALASSKSPAPRSSPHSSSHSSSHPSKLSGTPAAGGKLNVYAGARAGMLSETAKHAKSFVYVPNSAANTMQVIDPKTFKVIGTYQTGAQPQHVVPSWDLKTLWVNDDLGNDLVPIDPTTGRPGRRVHVPDPYNLYFTPNGAHALVMAERLRRIDVHNPTTMALQRSLAVPCQGVNHADYSADLAFFVASCEFSGKLLVVDREATRVLKVINLSTAKAPGVPTGHMGTHRGGARRNLQPGASAMPQDVRLTPDGSRFLVADMYRSGIWVIGSGTRGVERFIPTGKGAHGIYPDREGKRIFVSNRDEGSISVLDASSLVVIAKWRVPGGGSPDMGGVTADGTHLWLSGRYHNVVYVFNTATGALIKRIGVNAGPHGLLVWPQPGSFSLGHTGNTR